LLTKPALVTQSMALVLIQSKQAPEVVSIAVFASKCGSNIHDICIGFRVNCETILWEEIPMHFTGLLLLVGRGLLLNKEVWPDDPILVNIFSESLDPNLGTYGRKRWLSTNCFCT
jgi:hypothetical protein